MNTSYNQRGSEASAAQGAPLGFARTIPVYAMFHLLLELLRGASTVELRHVRALAALLLTAAWQSLVGVSAVRWEIAPGSFGAALLPARLMEAVT